MSVSNIDRILQREITVRRHNRVFLLAFSVASFIVLAALVTSL